MSYSNPLKDFDYEQDIENFDFGPLCRCGNDRLYKGDRA